MQRTPRRRGFSLIEFLIALTISSTLLAASLSALDASFKSYKATTESAAINVSTRLTMHRLTSLIRNGEEFGPYPSNPLATPEITTNTLEFTAIVHHDVNPINEVKQVWQISRVAQTGDLGPYRLDATITTMQGGVALGSPVTQTVMYRVKDAVFTLEYEPGPRLRRATIDLTVGQRQDQADTIVTDIDTPLIRMVSSVRPRRLED